MAKRTSGGRLTAAQRRKRREKSRGKDSLLRMPGTFRSITATTLECSLKTLRSASQV